MTAIDALLVAMARMQQSTVSFVTTLTHVTLATFAATFAATTVAATSLAATSLAVTSLASSLATASFLLHHRPCRVSTVSAWACIINGQWRYRAAGAL
jgi:hypothetical protein